MRAWRLTRIVVLGTFAVAAALAGQAANHRRLTTTPPGASLMPCATPQGDPAECGTLSVFENRSTKRGRMINIYFMVMRANTRGVHEALFMFAGGPGEGSTRMAGMAGWLMRPLRATMDLVLVDQRGTGRSHPLPCPSGAGTNPAGIFGHVFDPAVIARCRAALGRDADLTQYTTDLAVADIDDVRAALGYERVSLYGVSYGTRMAQAYVRRFPARVHAAVLDGTVPFDNAIPLTYAASAQQALNRVLAACAAQSDCHTAHPRLAADFAATLHRFDARAISATVRARGADVDVKMSRGDFGYAGRGVLYGANLVSELADEISRAAASGDVSEFAQQYWAREASFDSSLAIGMHLSVLCAEDVPFPTAKEIEASTSGTFLGRYLFDEYRGACAIWPRAPLASDARTPVIARVPTLLVSGFFDPVTPPAFADRIARSLPLARTVTAPNGSHGSLAGCPRDAALQVLTRGTLDGLPDVCR